MNIESIQVPGMGPQTPVTQASPDEGFFNLFSTLVNISNPGEDLDTPDLESPDLQAKELDLEAEAELEAKQDINFLFHPMLFVPQELRQMSEELDLDTPKIDIALEENTNTFDILNKEDRIVMSSDKETFKNKELPIEGEKSPLEVTDKTEFPNLDLKIPIKEKAEPIKDLKNEAKVEDLTPKDFKVIETSLREDLKLQDTPIDSVKANDNIQRLNDSIIRLMETTRVDNKSVMKVKLFPEELGTLDLTLEFIEGKVVARILVDNEGVKQLFTGKLNELNQNLIKQDIIIQDFKVEVKPEPNLDFNFSGGFNQNQSSKNYKERKALNLQDIPEEVVEKILKNARDKISILA